MEKTVTQAKKLVIFTSLLLVSISTLSMENNNNNQNNWAQNFKESLIKADSFSARKTLANNELETARKAGDQNKMEQISSIYNQVRKSFQSASEIGLGDIDSLFDEFNKTAKSEDDITQMFSDKLDKGIDPYTLDLAVQRLAKNGKLGVGPLSNLQYGAWGRNQSRVKGKNWKEKLFYSLEQGAYGAVEETLKEMFKEIFLKPSLSGVRFFTGSCENLFFKLLSNRKPLDEERLIIITNKLTKLISPYTQVSLGNFSKEKRAEIDSSASVNNNWIAIKNRIIVELDHTIKIFNEELVWYSSAMAKIKSNIIQRMFMGLREYFVSIDRESLRHQIRYTISDIEQMKKIIDSAKSLKEIQDQYLILKTWLAIVSQDLKYMGQLINYGSNAQTQNKERLIETSATGSSGSSKPSSGMSLSDLDLDLSSLK